jgi:hypothetical protein
MIGLDSVSPTTVATQSGTDNFGGFFQVLAILGRGGNFGRIPDGTIAEWRTAVGELGK